MTFQEMAATMRAGGSVSCGPDDPAAVELPDGTLVRSITAALSIARALNGLGPDRAGGAGAIEAWRAAKEILAG